MLWTALRDAPDLHLYEDGFEVGFVAATEVNVWTMDNPAVEHHLEVGSSNNWSHLDGDLAEIAIYKGALPDEQRKQSRAA